ncbi:hypothetical protein ACFONC_03380 [Luteimonas soli]|uniref:Uncharacterized protein n=1 Tax=Luteimonas soli TaxID=1648966 RepID=A0ABV7XJN3_9GAMM
MTNTIDMTPTWGEIGNVFRRFVESRETKAAMAMAPEIAKALAAAQALTAIQPTLTPDQATQVRHVMAVELAKQGFGRTPA